MRAAIQREPVYLFLLCLFFVFHGYTENFDFIPVKDAALLLLVYLFASLVLSGLLWLIFRNTSKTAFVAFLMMAFYFFFGAIYDRIIYTAPGSFFSKYTVIIGGFIFILLIMAVTLFRYKRSLVKFNYVLNVFLLLLLLVDTVWLVAKMIDPKVLSHASEKISVCDSCDKPDIYLIVPDEYVGDRALLETMNFDNSEFRQRLAERGFYTPESKSNYNYTPFSIASMFSMDYLKLEDGKNTSHRDLNVCYELIRQNHVFEVLEKHGYELHNYSIFDVKDQPSLVKESILPERTRFITAQTLFRRLDNNILFNMADKFGSRAKRKRLMLTYNSNERALASLKSLVKKSSAAPRFVYTHIVMPHYPYYFDQKGVFREFESMAFIQETNIDHYLQYLRYTNKVLLNLIDAILAKTEKPPVIILVSDHGFREYPTKIDRKYNFMNHLSVYLPGKNYTGFYDSISNVNLFRVFLNKQFNQRFTVLKDSMIYIRP
jgi:hypothetical protein